METSRKGFPLKSESSSENRKKLLRQTLDKNQPVYKKSNQALVSKRKKCSMLQTPLVTDWISLPFKDGKTIQLRREPQA